MDVYLSDILSTSTCKWKNSFYELWDYTTHKSPMDIPHGSAWNYIMFRIYWK
jgi:hypothetical protein